MPQVVGQHPRSCTGDLATITFLTGAQAGIGALTAAVFTTLNPVAGAVFGATAGFTSGVLSNVINRTGIIEDNTIISNIGKKVLCMIVGSIAATAVTIAMGYPITFTAAAYLSASTIATAATSVIVVGSCLMFITLAIWIIDKLINLPQNEHQQTQQPA